MARLPVLRILLREICTRERAQRVPEPLLMDSADQVAAYAGAGREAGSLAPLYLFHSSQVSEVICPGDIVVDLACGPANQLAQIARLNPRVHFIGVDFSETMVAEARRSLAEQQITNVEIRWGDITRLSYFADHSVDAVISMLAFHHLQDLSALVTAFREAARILKPGGGVYFADLGHLRSETSIHEFAGQYTDQQPEIFTLDYLNSLRAAFPLSAFQSAVREFAEPVSLFSTFVVPYLIVMKSRARRQYDDTLLRRIREMKRLLPDHQRRDLDNLRRFFRLGGLASPYLA